MGYRIDNAGRFNRLGPCLVQSFDDVDVAIAIERDVPGQEAAMFIHVLRAAWRSTSCARIPPSMPVFHDESFISQE